MAVIMPALSVTIFKIFPVEIMHDHDLDLSNGSKSNANILIESPYMTLFDCNVCSTGHNLQAILLSKCA